MVSVSGSELPSNVSALLELKPEEIKAANCRALALKADATEKFNKMDYDGARQTYFEALDIAMDDGLKAILYNNVSACYFSIKKYDECVLMSEKSLALDECYINPRYRRVKANLVLDTLTSLTKAKADVEKILELDSTHPVKNLDFTRRLTHAQEHEKEEMLAKLGVLGDKFLGTFGLSRDMFNITRDEAGGYSIKTPQK